MAMQKGKSGNPNGRPKGARNKVTNDVRAFICRLLDNNADQIERDFKALESGERMRITEKLFQYIIPKQQAQQIDLNAISESDINAIAANVLNNLNKQDNENRT